MGTWDWGPFDNDGAAQLISETGGSAAGLEAVLRTCADMPLEDYLDVDDGQPGIAACEMVALGFGYGNLDKAPKQVRAIVRTLGPNETLRLLAIRALGRIRGPGSEIASLWEHDPAFDARLANLLERLTEAGD